MSGLIVTLAVLLSQTPPEGSEAADAISAAREHLQSGRYAEALEAWTTLAGEESLDADQHAAVAIGLSLTQQDTGAWQAATETLRRAVAGPHPSAELWARLAEIEFLQGRYEAAALAVDSAQKLDAENPRSHLIRAHVFRETGKPDEALAEYQWCVRYYNRAQPEDADTLLVIAEGSLEYARWKRVTNIFNFVVNTLCPDALKNNERCWQAHLLCGGLLLEKYNQAQAIPELNAALAVNPAAAPVLAALGTAALQDLKYEDAGAFADRALETNPKLPDALLLKADIALADGDTAGAHAYIDRAKAVNAADQRILAREALACLLDDGVPPDDELLTVFFHLDAIADLDLPQRSRCSEILIHIAQTNPRPGYFLGIIGEALDAHRQYDAAERFYRQAMNVMPQLSAPQTNLGMLYMRTGRIEEARQILDQAFRADPFHVRVSNMRKVLDVLEGYDAVSSDHFVIRADAANHLLAETMSEYLESIYPELTERYQYEPPTRTQFEIYSAAKGQGAHEWFSARMVGLPWIQTIGASTGMIVALASPTDREPFNWARVVRHEFVHILTLQETGFNIPHWYTEALAVKEEGLDMPDEWQDLLLERFGSGDLFNLQTVNSGFQRPQSADDWTLAYCQSHLYARYMVARFGDDALTRLLDVYRRNVATPEAVPEAFGVELDDFESGYSDFLQGLVTDLRAQRSPPWPELDAAEAAYNADTKNAEAAGRYAVALLRAERFRDAGRLAGEAVELDPHQPDANYVRARFSLGRQNDDEAVERLVTGLDESSPHSEVLALLAKLRLDAGEYEEAARLYEIGSDLYPAEDRWWNGLAVALWRLDDTQRLRPVLEVAAARDFDNPDVRKKLAQIALADKRYDDAVRWGTDALCVDILDPEVHRLLADAHIALGDPTRAARQLNVVLELDPGNAEARTLLESLGSKE